MIKIIFFWTLNLHNHYLNKYIITSFGITTWSNFLLFYFEFFLYNLPKPTLTFDEMSLAKNINVFTPWATKLKKVFLPTKSSLGRSVIKFVHEFNKVKCFKMHENNWTNCIQLHSTIKRLRLLSSLDISMWHCIIGPNSKGIFILLRLN